MSKIPKPSGKLEIKIPEAVKLNCATAPGLWYFDHFKETKSPPSIYKKIVSDAEKRVWVWDPYVHNGDEILFEDVNKEVNIRILTNERFANQVPEKTMSFIEALGRIQRIVQFKLDVRVYNTIKDEEKSAFHDRYLIVDDHVYSVGSSIQYHRRRVSSTSIHQIIHADAKKLIEEKFSDLWNHENTNSTYSSIGGQL